MESCVEVEVKSYVFGSQTPGLNDTAIAKIDGEFPFEHNERLVGRFMRVPDEIAFHPHELELDVVHLRNHFRLKMLGEFRELVGERDRLKGHGGRFRCS